MATLNKHILRSIMILSYILIVIGVVFGISKIVSYLNTGADRSEMLNLNVETSDPYTPQVNWNTKPNRGRSVSENKLSEIEKDYLNAWYVKQMAYNTNTKKAVKDHFTKRAREKINDIINHNKANNVKIESTTLSHNIDLNFFSEDGKIAVITDKDMIIHKRYLKNDKLLSKVDERATYKVILFLEDGFWRIRHMVKLANEDNTKNIATGQYADIDINGINYYPQSNPWETFGSKFSIDTIKKDFKIIRSAGLNTIRLFVPYKDFGKNKVDDDKLKSLKNTLDVAKRHELKVIVTLFDFYGDYSTLNWTLTQKHASIIVKKLKEHEALLAWDIKNEPDLDFETRGKDLVISWLSHMIDLIRSIDKKNAITIGWYDPQSSKILKDQVDLISFHYYKPIDMLDNTLLKLKEQFPEKPIVMQEYGISSYNGFWDPFGNSEEDQADYHKKAQQMIKKHDISYMSWTLYDFNNIPNKVIGWKPWEKQIQKKYGFIDKEGNKKPAFRFISGD